MEFTTESGSSYTYDRDTGILIRLEGVHDIRTDYGQGMKVLKAVKPIKVGEKASFLVDVPFDATHPHTYLRTSKVTKILED